MEEINSVKNKRLTIQERVRPLKIYSEEND